MNFQHFHYYRNVVLENTAKDCIYRLRIQERPSIKLSKIIKIFTAVWQNSKSPDFRVCSFPKNSIVRIFRTPESELLVNQCIYQTLCFLEHKEPIHFKFVGTNTDQKVKWAFRRKFLGKKLVYHLVTFTFIYMWRKPKMSKILIGRFDIWLQSTQFQPIWS